VIAELACLDAGATIDAVVVIGHSQDARGSRDDTLSGKAVRLNREPERRLNDFLLHLQVRVSFGVHLSSKQSRTLENPK
jgi:hypothetical protein